MRSRPLTPSPPSPRALAAAVLALALTAGCKAPEALRLPDRAPPLKVEFQPPPSLTERFRVRRSPAAGVAPVQVEGREELRFAREGAGWVVSRRVLEWTAPGGAETPYARAVRAVVVRSQLALDGTFVRVLEPGAPAAALEAAGVTGEEARALERFFAPHEVERAEAEAWAARTAGLFGRSLAVGRPVEVAGALPLQGGGDARYVLRRTLTGSVVTDHGEALVFDLRCVPGAAGAAPANGGPGPAVVTCAGEQVVARGRFVPVRSRLEVRTPDGSVYEVLRSVDTVEAAPTPPQPQDKAGGGQR